jgi:type IV pilus assembly protein PilO
MAKFTEMPAKVQLAIVVGVLLLATGGLYWFVYKDMAAANVEAKKRLDAKLLENAQLRPYADRKADMERRIATLRDQLDQMNRIVPSEKEAAQFMEMMQAEARKAGVEIRRYTPKPTATREFFTEVPWDIEIDGPYYSVLRFFENVAAMDRIVNISNMRMASTQKPGDAGVRRSYQYAPTETVVVSCVATTFFSREQQPMPVAAKR